MKTTLNIDSRILDKIDKEARSRNVCSSAMIIMLLKKIMDKKINSKTIRVGRLIEYQRIKSPDWHIFHIDFREDEVDYFLDLRKLLKMSLSKIVAWAVGLFLGKKRKRDDNYFEQYQNYVIVPYFIDSIPAFKLIWGIPPTLKDHIK